MRPFASIDTTPLHVLFPEDYERSKRMIVQDFAFMGGIIVLSAIGIATWMSLVA